MPDGLRLTDAFRASCGCVFGGVEPEELGLDHEPGQVAFVCVPCSLVCPTYLYFRQQVNAQGKPTQVVMRRDT